MTTIKKIQAIKLSAMRSGAHFTFATEICARAESDAKVTNQAEDLVEALRQAIEVEDAALKLSKKSLLTDDIDLVDARRDKAYMAYKKAVDACRSLTDETMAKAAKVLWQHIKDYNVSIHDQMDQETGLLMNLITDLEGKYKEQVETLSLSLFVTQMKQANEEIRSLTLQRTNERMGQTVGALQNARLATDDAYRDLVEKVNALAIVNGVADYESFIDYVNTEVTHYKRNALKQKSTASSTSSNSNNNGSSGDGNGSSDGGSDSTGSGSESTDGGSDSTGSESGGNGGGGSSEDKGSHFT